MTGGPHERIARHRAQRFARQELNSKVKQMLLMAVGAGMATASMVLLQLVRFREGQVSTRPERLDISLAILVTSGLSIGFVCLVAGAASWFTGVPF